MDSHLTTSHCDSVSCQHYHVCLFDRVVLMSSHFGNWVVDQGNCLWRIFRKLCSSEVFHAELGNVLRCVMLFHYSIQILIIDQRWLKISCNSQHIASTFYQRQCIMNELWMCASHTTTDCAIISMGSQTKISPMFCAKCVTIKRITLETVYKTVKSIFSKCTAAFSNEITAVLFFIQVHPSLREKWIRPLLHKLQQAFKWVSLSTSVCEAVASRN